MTNAINYTPEHEAAAGSLAKHLGIDCPLPYVVNQSIEWHLKEREDAKEKLIEKLVEGLYCNDRKSYRKKVREALANFNITEKG